MVWIGRNSASGMSRHSAWQSNGGKNISEDIGMTNVLALIRPNAARRSPSVWRLTSPRWPFPCHAQQIVWIHYAEVAIHEIDDEIVHGRKTQRLMAILLKNSVLQPITVHILAWRSRPSRTSGDDV
jgi:hypothetical protein